MKLRQELERFLEGWRDDLLSEWNTVLDGIEPDCSARLAGKSKGDRRQPPAHCANVARGAYRQRGVWRFGRQLEKNDR
jgi:hypothetical protein